MGRKGFFPMFHKYMVLAFLLVLGSQLSACAVGLPILFVTAHDAGAGDEKLPFVEIQDIKVGKGLDISTIKSARVMSSVLKKDETLNDSPHPSDKEVNVAVTEEVKRSLGISNTPSSATLRISTFYYDGGYPWGYPPS